MFLFMVLINGLLINDTLDPAQSAAALCMTLANADPAQTELLSQHADQAAQKAAWSVNWLDSYFAPSDGKAGGDCLTGIIRDFLFWNKINK